MKMRVTLTKNAVETVFETTPEADEIGRELEIVQAFRDTVKDHFQRQAGLALVHHGTGTVYNVLNYDSVSIVLVE